MEVWTRVSDVTDRGTRVSRDCFGAVEMRSTDPRKDCHPVAALRNLPTSHPIFFACLLVSGTV